MQKILFSDIDGTLYHDGQIKHKKDQDMIKKLHEKGYAFSFCTGRNLSEMTTIIEDFDYDYLILNNGATIFDKDLNPILDKKIPGKEGQEIIEYIMENYPHLALSFYDGIKMRVIHNHKNYTFVAHEFIEDEYDFMNGYKQMDSYEIICCFDFEDKNDEVKDVQKYINTKYHNEATATLNVKYLDITAANCSKGRGIETLIEYLGKDIDSYCIGDSYNDISMFKVANHPYTFNDVENEIKEYTNKQVDYVYQVMEDMLEE